MLIRNMFRLAAFAVGSVVIACSVNPSQTAPVNISAENGGRISMQPKQTVPERDGSETDTPPVTVKILGKMPGKPPQQIYTAKIQYRNRRNEPIWLITRYHGDVPLPSSGIFTNDNFSQRPFISRLYAARKDRGTGRVVLIQFLGKDTFTAVRLPPGGDIRFDEFRFWADSNISDFEVWEATALSVNGKTPLEEWLPYETLSDQNVHVLKSDDWKPLRGADKTGAGSQNHPTEKADFVSVQIIKKWIIPLTRTINRR